MHYSLNHIIIWCNKIWVLEVKLKLGNINKTFDTVSHDTVSHDILLRKLEYCGFSSNGIDSSQNVRNLWHCYSRKTIKFKKNNKKLFHTI